MKRGISLLLAAASIACQRAAPLVVPPGPPASFTSPFEARAWGPEGRYRFRGLMAAEGGTRFRAEVAAPSVTSPLIVVASPQGILASLVSQRLYFRGGPGAPLLKEMAGVPIEIGAIPRLLDPALGGPPEGCTVSRRSWHLLPEGPRIPEILTLRCGDSGLRLHLSEVRPLGSEGNASLFSLDPPGGYREAALPELIDSLKRSSRPPP
jgi:hypothetical protein